MGISSRNTGLKVSRVKRNDAAQVEESSIRLTCRLRCVIPFRSEAPGIGSERANTKSRVKGAKVRAGKGQGPLELACKICGAAFETRSKLFKHIAAKGHAALRQ